MKDPFLADKKFYLEVPDPNFSPERNKAVVEKTIKAYDAMRLKKIKENRQALGERADAIATYFKVLRQGKHPHLKKFFSKKYLAYLRGDDIREELMSRINFVNGMDKDKFLRMN